MEITFSDKGDQGHIGHLIDGAERRTLHLVRHSLVEPLVHPVQDFVDRSAAIHATFLPDAAKAEMLRAAQPVLSVLGTSIGAARKARSDWESADIKASEIPKTVDRARFVEIRQFYNNLSAADRQKRAMTAPLVELAALIDGGDLVHLPEPIRAEVKRRFMLLAHVERSGLSANYQRQPKPDNLIAIGPDNEAAGAAAVAALIEHEARAEALNSVEKSLQSVLAFIGMAIRQSPAATLQMALT